MKRVVALCGAWVAAFVAAGSLFGGVAQAASPFQPPGELTCGQLFSNFARDQRRLELQEQKRDKTVQNISDLIDLAANAQSSNASSFFQSQLDSQFSLLQAQEQNIAQGQLVVAQDQALLTQQGCNTA